MITFPGGSASRGLRALSATAALLAAVAVGRAAPPALIPPDSVCGRLGDTWPPRLLAACEATSEITPGNWKMTKPRVTRTTDDPCFGLAALTLTSTAEIPGAKGDCAITMLPPDQCRYLGMWVRLSATANVARVGFQVTDAEGEGLLCAQPVTPGQWQWVEVDLESEQVTPAWTQKERNGKVDLPLRGVHLVWFTATAGETALTVDAVLGFAPAAAGGAAPFTAQLYAPAVQEQAGPYGAGLVCSNPAATAQPVTVAWRLQRDAAWREVTPPDPALGRNRARGAVCWTVADGTELERGSLTNGVADDGVSTPWQERHWTEAFQYVDLGRSLRVSGLTYESGDSNWVSKVDVSASPDGQTFTEVQGLQGVDLYHRWGHQTLAFPTPFEARVIRLRYHSAGRAANVIRMISELQVYDGAVAADWELPDVGPTVATGTQQVTLPPHSFQFVALTPAATLDDGALLLAVDVQAGTQRQQAFQHVLVLPPAPATITPENRFGLNTSLVELATQHRRLGVGWVRFENLKWAFCSPAKGDFRYDGSVAPWHVNEDAILAEYHRLGLNVLPFLFLTPEHQTTAGEEVVKNRLSWPPKDNGEYGEFVFQTVARYGSRAVPAAELKTPDHTTGLNELTAVELWNEPTLNAPGYGAWVGELGPYYEMMRVGAEAAKRANPAVQVANGGFAGCSVPLLDTLLRHTYADGKHPLDFVDILNVHYYCGRVPPETATIDPNEKRAGAKETRQYDSYEDTWRHLTVWRDAHKPGAPLWLTENGHDTGGPIGISERLQAARIPREIMLAFANGAAKVFVYREQGSTPSMHAAAGLQRDDGTLKPSWLTYATLIRQLEGIPGAALRLPHPDPRVRVYLWQRGGSPLLTAWTSEGSAPLGTALGTATITDAFGHATPSTPVGADYVLGEFPVYLSGFADAAPLAAWRARGEAAEKERVAHDQQEAKRPAFLFDFGSADHVGWLTIGEPRRFTPVPAATVLGTTGHEDYGFSPRAAITQDDHAWMNDDLDRDTCRMGKGVDFVVHLPAGRYAMSLRATPLHEQPATLQVLTDGQPAVELTATAKQPLLQTAVTVTGTTLTLRTTDYLDVAWLTLIKSDEK